MSQELLNENIKKAQEEIEKTKDKVSEGKMRQNYHFMAQQGWINDPNGLIYYKNKYHFFYQYNPYDAYWGAMHWGHAISDDMLHWEYLPVALAPSEPYDNHKEGGCFSGSAIEHDGKLYLVYTGTTNYGDGFIQSQCLAYSEDGVHFEKYENNPIMQSNTLVHGAGHHGIVSSPDGSEMFIVYHCHSSLTKTEPRRLCIDRIHFTKDDAGKTVLEVYGPTITPQEMPKSGNTISKGIEINGYQISATLGGMRTVYSVDSVINQKEVIGYGMLYSLADYADEEDMHVGSSSKYVKSVEGTKNGQLSINASDSDIASSYAMTVCFTSKQAAEYTDKWTVKAYAKLIDGTYVYSDAKTFCAYDVADILYKNSMMNNISAHNYLYENILTLVNKEYTKVEYSKSSVVR